MSRPIEGHRRERVRERVEEARGAAQGRPACGSAAWRISPSVDEAARPRRAPARGSWRHPGASAPRAARGSGGLAARLDRESTRLNSRHPVISYAVFFLKKKKKRNK